MQVVLVQCHLWLLLHLLHLVVLRLLDIQSNLDHQLYQLVLEDLLHLVVLGLLQILPRLLVLAFLPGPHKLLSEEELKRTEQQASLLIPV